VPVCFAPCLLCPLSALPPLSFTAWTKGKFGPSVYKRAKKAGQGILALKAMMHGNWPKGMKESERRREKAWYEPFDEIAKRLGLTLEKFLGW